MLATCVGSPCDAAETELRKARFSRFTLCNLMRFLFSCAAFALIVSQCSAVGQPQQKPSARGADLAQRVYEIFEAKCVDCHSSELPRPKGKFGYVLDLERVADNPDYVVRGRPNESEIYLMVRDDEMPGEDANVPPLTPEEKEVVRRWVELGAPGHFTPTPEMEQTSAATTDPLPRPLPLWKRTVRWIGRFHPLSTHFPVALMLVAVAAEALAWWSRRDAWMQTVRFLVILGALGALVAAGLGWINASFTSYIGESASILWWHRWLGTFTAIWAAVCAALSVIGECREGTAGRQRFRGALLLGALLVAVSGFLGSALIYGLDHYAWD